MIEQIVRIKNEIDHRTERGATLAEYGLLLILVALAAVAILSTFGVTISDTFGLGNETLENSPAGNGGGANN